MRALVFFVCWQAFIAIDEESFSKAIMDSE